MADKPTQSNPNEQWHIVLRQQAVINARRWLTALETSHDPGLVATENYESILRALENLLVDPHQLDLFLAIIEKMRGHFFSFADWERLYIYLQKALDQVVQQGDELHKAYLLDLIGHIFYVQGNWLDAIDHFKQAVNLFQKHQRHESYAKTLSQLGQIISKLGKINEGLDLCQQALQVAQEINSEKTIAQVHWNLADIYQQIRQWEDAFTSAQLAYSYYENHASNNSRHLLQQIIISASSHLGRWEEVATLAQLLTESLTQAGEINKLASLKMHLGVIGFEREDYRQAEALWYEALQLYSQIQSPSNEAPLYNNLGHLYTKLGEWDVAETYLRKAIEIYADLGHPYNQADSLDNLAECYRMQNKLVACRCSLDEAISLLEQVDTSASYYQQLLEKLRRDRAQLA